MRRILISDLVATARVLVLCRPVDRPVLLDQLLSQAQAADRFSRRFGRPHPEWGNGSLLARALAEPCCAQPDDPLFYECLGLVAFAVSARRRAARDRALGLGAGCVI